MSNKKITFFVIILFTQIAAVAELVTFTCHKDFEEIGSKGKKVAEICFDSKMKFAISRSCTANRNCLALKSLKEVTRLVSSGVLKPTGTPAANLCIKTKGSPKYFSQASSNQVWSLCEYSDNSFIDFDALSLNERTEEHH